MDPILHLVDVSASVVAAWRTAFARFPEVQIHHGDIIKLAKGAVVSPANSYGEMGGGVDLAYRDHFGRQIERKVQDRIAQLFGNYMPIGEALIVETGRDDVTHLISAPTMFLPEPTTAENVELAMAAVLGIARLHTGLFRDLFCPGMGTFVGRLAPKDAAEAMASAYARHTAELEA